MLRLAFLLMEGSNLFHEQGHPFISSTLVMPSTPIKYAQNDNQQIIFYFLFLTVWRIRVLKRGCQLFSFELSCG